MFASRGVVIHLFRGGVGLAALVAALAVGPDHPLLALGLVPVALFALRGCPACWLLGLVQTLAARGQGRGRGPTSCRDGRCAVPGAQR